MIGGRESLGFLAIIVLLLHAAQTHLVGAPIGTAFTYQGRFSNGGSPANGVYDFQFKLFDAATEGSQVGSTVTKDNVDVSDGYFTTTLDFGAGVFTGDARWLQIAVRPGAETGAYTTLTPRHELTPTPYTLGITAFKTDAANYNVLVGDSVAPDDNGQYNTMVGIEAGRNNDYTTGNEGMYSVYIGYQAGYGGTAATKNTGYRNVGVGHLALHYNTTGYSNIAIGPYALYNNTAGNNNNNASGLNALRNNTEGIYNNAMGQAALQMNTTGDGNCGVGYAAVYTNQTGDDNTGIGRQALRNVTGGGNVGIGAYAGYNQTSSSDLLVIDNQNRGSAANEVTNSLLYGTFNADPDSQNLRCNGVFAHRASTRTLGAGATTLAVNANIMTVTGDSGGNTIATITGGLPGMILTLIFVDANVTIADDNTHAANNTDLSAAFTSADGTVLQLVYDGTSWYEIARSVN